MSESQVMPSRARLFGTDGIRGLPGEPPLDRATVTRLGFRLAETVRDHSPVPRVVVGGDTRESTPQLCDWIIEGLEAGGAEPAPVGVVPTPGVAYLAWRLEAAAGVAVGITRHSDDVNPSAGMNTYFPLRDRKTDTSFSTLSSWKTFTSWSRAVPIT